MPITAYSYIFYHSTIPITINNDAVGLTKFFTCHSFHAQYIIFLCTMRFVKTIFAKSIKIIDIMKYSYTFMV